MKLSICMMVKNESKYLRQCLESLQPLRDAIESELIIVDTGSTDNTVKIAQLFTDKVFFHKWNDDFSAMRNISLSYATGEWLFIIDGDEVLQGIEELIGFLKSNIQENYNAGSIYVKNFTDEGKWSKFSLIASTRLFRRTKDFHFEGAIHNQPVFSGPVIMINAIILHYGYISNDPELMERKFQRTRKILISELEKEPENIYYLYQLSVTYGMHKEYDKALEPIEKAYSLIHKKRLNIRNYMYVLTAKAMFYQNLRNVAAVERICREGIEAGGEYLDLYFFLAESLMHQERNDVSLENYEKYVHMIEHYTELPKDPSVIDYTLSQVDVAYNRMCTLYYSRKEYEKALAVALKITDTDILAQAFKRIIDLHIELKKYGDLAIYYEKNILPLPLPLRVAFEQDMEFMRQYWSAEEEECIARAFAQKNTEYGFFHFAWLANREKRIESIVTVDVDLTDKTENYGELVYWLLGENKKREQLVKLLSTTTEEKWNQFVSYAYKTFENKFFERILKFVRDSKHVNSVFDCQLAKAFARYALLFSLSNNPLRNEMLTLYLRYGCEYVEKLYRSEVIHQENCNWFSNAEDSFFIMTWRAKRLLGKKREEAFVEATREILEKTPQMRKWCNFAEWKQALSEI